MRVVGNPGGLLHLREGVVVAVDSPGAPGAETLLLRSGRLSEQDWNAALREGTGTRSHQATLVARGAIGASAVQALVTMATQDGSFAIAAGDVEQCVVDDEPVDVLLTAADGMPPDLLLSETLRRLDALASMPFPLSPYRERVVPGRGTDSPAATEARRKIIEHATGRRTARDIAFVVGRSVYPTTVEISRMLTEGLLEIAPPAISFSSSHWGLTSLRPRAAAERTATPGTDDAGSLPTRRPGEAAPVSRKYLRPSGWHGAPEAPGLSGTEGKNIGL